MRILYVCSILQESPTLLPVPPIAGGAPRWNVFRLTEALEHEQDLNRDIQLTVVSACERPQLPHLMAFPHHGDYHWYCASDFDRFVSRLISKNKYASALLRRLFGEASWLSFQYLTYAVKLFRRDAFDLFVLDDSPQSLELLRRSIPKQKLVFMFRGQIGRSRKYLSECCALLTTNIMLTEYIKEVLPADREAPAIFVVPNSLDHDFSHKTDQEADTGNKDVIVFVGRIVPGKGILELIKAFSYVLEEFPNSELRVVGANRHGSATLSDYEREVHRFAESFPVGSVTFRGYIPYKDIVAEYRDAKLAVFPSIMTEGFGMTALEAMRCGIPVIVSDRPGFRSFVQDGKNGVIVKDPTVIEDLADAIIQLLKDPIRREALASSGYQTSLRFSPQASVNAFKKAMNTIHSSSIIGGEASV